MPALFALREANKAEKRIQSIKRKPIKGRSSSCNGSVRGEVWDLREKPSKRDADSYAIRKT